MRRAILAAVLAVTLMGATMAAPAAMSNDRPDWQSVVTPAAQVFSDTGRIVGSTLTVNGNPFTPSSYLIHGWVISATLSGTNPGTSEAVLSVTLTDGTHVVNMTNLQVTNGAPTVAVVMLPASWAPPGLNRSGTWLLQYTNASQLGTAQMFVSATMLYS